MNKIAILIAFKNSATKIEKSTTVIDLENCLISIIASKKKLSLESTCKYITEIYLIDDHSKEKYSHLISASILQEINIISNVSSPGQGNALNYGLENIKAHYYAFTDSDCVVDVNWLNNITSFFTLYPSRTCVVGPNWIHQRATRKLQLFTTNNESQLMKFIFCSYVDKYKKSSERIDCRNFAINSSFFKYYSTRRIFSNAMFTNSSQTSHEWRNSDLDMISQVGFDSKLVVYHKFIPSLSRHINKYYKRGKYGDFRILYAEKYNSLAQAFFKYYFKRHFITPLFESKVNFFYLWLVHSAFWFGIASKQINKL